MAMIEYNMNGRNQSAAVEANPLEGYLKMEGVDLPEPEVDVNRIVNSAFDGQYLWHTTSTNRVLRTDTETCETIVYTIENGVNGNTNVSYPSANQAIVFDGKYIWLLPVGGNTLVRIERETGTMTGFQVDTNEAYRCGVYDGTWIWMAGSSKLARMDPATGLMVTTAVETAGVTSMVFDGENLWLLKPGKSPAYSNNTLIKVSTGDLERTEYPTPAEVLAQFSLCLYDGSSIWLVHDYAGPDASNKEYDTLLKFHPDSESFSEYNANVDPDMDVGPYNFKPAGAFDGKYLWLVSSINNQLIRVNAQTGAMHPFAFMGPNLGQWKGQRGIASTIVFDGHNLWLSEGGYNTNIMVKVSPINSTDPGPGPDPNTLAITLRYQDQTGAMLRSSATDYAQKGSDYTATAPTLSGYSVVGYKLDGGSLQTGNTASIDDVQSSHTIVFVYKENEGGSNPDPGPDPGPGVGCGCCAKVKIEIEGCGDSQLIRDVCGSIEKRQGDCSCDCGCECQ